MEWISGCTYLSLDTRWRWTINFRPRPIYPKAKMYPDASWIRGWRGTIPSPDAIETTGSVPALCWTLSMVWGRLCVLCRLTNVSGGHGTINGSKVKICSSGFIRWTNLCPRPQHRIFERHRPLFFPYRWGSQFTDMLVRYISYRCGVVCQWSMRKFSWSRQIAQSAY